MLVLGCPDCGKEHLLLSDDQAITCDCGFVLTDEKSVKVGVKVTVPKITQGKVRVYDGGIVKANGLKPIFQVGKNCILELVNESKPFFIEIPFELKVIYTARMHATVRMLEIHGFL